MAAGEGGAGGNLSKLPELGDPSVGEFCGWMAAGKTRYLFIRQPGVIRQPRNVRLRSRVSSREGAPGPLAAEDCAARRGNGGA